ncbi:MAG: DUF3810 family protein [Bacteroidota bacterium]
MIRWVFDTFPTLTELVYGQVLFPSLRWVLDYTLGLIPFPSLYLFLAFIVFAFVKSIFGINRLWQNPQKKILSILNFWAWLLSSFLIVWGFNYQRPEIAERLEFKEIQLRTSAYDRLVERSIDKLESIQYQDQEFNGVSINLDIDELRRAQGAFLENLGYVKAGNVQLETLYPNGILSSFGISGIYLPWVGQGNVDGCLSNLEKPFIAAHEMAHAYGVTNEGEASFVAYMTCWASKNDLYRYSAEIYLLRNLLFRLKIRDEKHYQYWLSKIPKKVKQDIAFIKEHRTQFPNLMPELSVQLNNTYLQSQGIESGSKSYGELIELLYSWSYERPQ